MGLLLISLFIRTIYLGQSLKVFGHIGLRQSDPLFGCLISALFYVNIMHKLCLRALFCFQFSLTLYIAYTVLVHRVYILRCASLFLMNIKISNISKRTNDELSISKLVKKNLCSDLCHFA